MKSLAYFLVFSIVLSFALSSALSYSSHFHGHHHKKNKCASECMACQQTAYDMKFKHHADCHGGHCRTTCHKVKQAWNAPNSPFAGFQNDSYGKCMACFRANMCTMKECSAQRNYEVAIINTVVEKASLSGFVDKKEMKKVVGKIMANKKVNFKKSAKKVKKNVKKVAKKLNKKNLKKLAKSVKHMVLSLKPAQIKKLAGQADKDIKKFKSINHGLLKNMKSFVEKYHKLIVKNSKKHVSQAQKKKLKQEGASILKKVNAAMVKMLGSRPSLLNIQKKFQNSKDKNAMATLKKITAVLALIEKAKNQASAYVAQLNKEIKSVDSLKSK